MRSTERLFLRAAGSAFVLVAATHWALLVLPSSSALAEEELNARLPLSAPVKLLGAQDAPSQQFVRPAAAPQPQRPQPTLPGGKLPQYSLRQSHGRASMSSPSADGHLTFILALPTQPIRVRALVTIDGQPFPMARERRIERILEAAMQSASESQGSQERGDASEAEQPPAEQPETAPYSLAASAEETVRRYAEAIGRTPSREEVHWLLASRVDGPTLLMVNDTFQRFRASQRPVFHVLDRDRDGVISAAELERAVASFQECDLNRDDIIDYAELARAAKAMRPPHVDDPAPGKLIFEMDDAAPTDASASMFARFDANGDGRIDPEELQYAAADLTLAVAFNTTDPAKSTIAVTALGAGLEPAAAGAAVDGGAISLPIGGALVALSAVQAGDSDQISLGAVNDGYPMLPALDPDDDGRFTLRELRELMERLRRFDLNQDGQLTVDEAQPTIRVCFGLGPLAHRELARVRSVNPRAPAPTVAAPQWFVRMDRNKDNDLTRSEFPGTDEQFQALDADGDGLISGQEAADFDRKSPSPP